ncbi:MAG: hypothetical protein P0Y50_10240 [Candidatus Brevundimonas colombiensis]|uniref:Rap1a immunity protein domain-containing protein n=1 Tax=Candidatus Brevundimonas colombiensis TaxID=3121376 RepID=A0AAJ6BJ21_9CAUL|nr:hypothetical protein [Brevundimonas sp.]WEK38928.1 MAG: hypothetical protein P0Y50_10240 [Brevundimonas sp.]
MRNTTIAAGAVALSLLAGAAQAMTVQEFLTTANRIPQNPTALLRTDTRRLMAEFRSAARTVRAEQAAATAAGRPPATCMPDKISMSPDQILAHFNAIPPSRRTISVTQAMREWMALDYPCRS